MRLFRNRTQAAEELAQHLAFLKDDHPIVLGLANGGVPLADVVARALNAPLDVLLIHKLFGPGPNPQVVGAVDEHGRISMIQMSARWHHVTSQQMVEPAREAYRQLQRLQARVRAIMPELDVRGRTVIVIGQGLATGAKMLAAVSALRDRGAAKVVAAAPAGTEKASWQLHEAANMVVIPHRPAKFKGIDNFYEDFSDVTDNVVVAIIERWMQERPPQALTMRTITMKLTNTLDQPLICEVDLPPGARRGGEPYPAVIFAHGFESNARSSRNLAISQRLAMRGLIGVRVDFTGHGRSGGTINDASDVQMINDLHTTFQNVAVLAEVDANRMGLVGSGTGGMIALHYAAQIPAVKALVIRGPVCGRETIAARQVKAPTLLIHAESDTALFDSVQSLDRELAAPHQLLRIANSNRLFADPISMELMVSATVDWLVDHLVVGAAPAEIVTTEKASMSASASVDTSRSAEANPA